MTRSVDDVLDTLDRSEKLALVRGVRDPSGTATGYLPGIDRVDVPPLRFVDGPLGVRIPDRGATAFPAPIAVGASFDPGLARRVGAAIAREARAYDQDVLLAPAVNLIRVPQAGRTFECFAEDPLLSGRCGAASVAGIESEGVLATPKHYVANNQETNRATVSADVDERTLRELYLPAFQDAVDAGAGAIMTAYNRVNGTHMSEHRRLVRDVLKDEWGFDGITISDWYGTESTVEAALAGLDVEMPGVAPEGWDGHADDGDGERDGKEHDVVDDDTPNRGDGDRHDANGEDDEDAGDGSAVDDGEPIDLALSAGLPDPTNVGLFGEPLARAIDRGDVPAARLDDMAERVLHAHDRLGTLGSSPAERQDGALDTPAHRSLAIDAAVRGTVLLKNDGVVPLAPDANVALIGPNVERATLGGGGSSETTPIESTPTAEGVRERSEGSAEVRSGVDPFDRPSFFDMLDGSGTWEDPNDRGCPPESALEPAVEAAESADVAVVVLEDVATEGADTADLRLPPDQTALVDALTTVSTPTVAVVQSSGPVELPWRSEVDALLATWYPGQADGAALARVLYGDDDPGGRLPVTFAPTDAYPTSDRRRFPGIDGRAAYDEGVFVGYRAFDAADEVPTYPFGHGRSYAELTYEGVELADDRTVRVTIRNDDDRAGRAVPQAYVEPPSSSPVERPVRELAGASSVQVEPHTSTTVELDLDDRAFARYDDGWIVDSGAYEVRVGRSSRSFVDSVTVVE